MRLDAEQIRTIYKHEKQTMDFSNSKYSKECRINAVKLCKEIGVVRVAARLGVAQGTVRLFITQSNAGLLE